MTIPTALRSLVGVVPLAGFLLLGAASSDRGPGGRQAPISNLSYELGFGVAEGAGRSLEVVTRFEAAAAGPLLLSLPAWTPGAYEISNFARNVSEFAATQKGTAVQWDKTDPDTWRLILPAAGAVEIRFRFLADSLDNAMAWSKPDFLLVNGTNVFLYPEAASLELPATVTVRTEADWTVATGMRSTGPRRYGAASYHELVDRPFFIGKLDLDSAEVGGTWHRVASYPAGALAGPARELFWQWLGAMMPPMSRVFAETPWTDYTTLLIFDPSFPGGSALEHENSHVGIYTPAIVGNPLLASITAHEIFHAWNVKRLRPAEMVPYRYDRELPTTLLWVSEGITDYYADLALLRGGIIDSTVFLNVTMGKMAEVAEAPPVALEDASLSTWIHPTDGTHTIYYPKGSLAGLLLDVLIRDASANRQSLDDVLRKLYRATYQQGRGFTNEQWWAAVSEAAGGKSFEEFYRRYIDGRDPFPWATVAPLAGLRYQVDSVREPRIGVSTAGEGSGPERVATVAAGSAAARAGILPGDELISIGTVKVDPSFGFAFRQTYGSRIGETVPVVVRREGRELTLSLVIEAVTRSEERLEFDRRASLKAQRVRHGLLTGGTEP